MTNQNANDSQIEVGNQPPAPPGANDQAQLHCGNKVYKSGPLFLSSKVGIGWTSWKKRWFTLTETSLVFYRSDPTVTPQKGGEVNLTLGGIDLNSSGSVVVKEDKKLLTVLFPDDRDGRFVTLKAETLEDLLDWKAALEEALASAPSVDSLPGQNEVSRNDQASAVDLSTELSKDREPAKSLVLGQPVLLALEDIDGTPSFLEKALRFMEEHGVRVEGILRQAADVENVERRIREYEQGKSEFSPDEDAHVIADCVKYILRELPSSPVPTSCCNALLEAFRTERATRVNCMRSAIFETFPEPNRHLLQRILMMMQTVVFHKIENRMSTPAVAACMAPLLLRPLLAGECEIESDFEMGTDGSVQLIQAAAAANHAQAIVITLLEEYDKLFAEGSVLPELYSDSDGSRSESEELSDDDESYEDDSQEGSDTDDEFDRESSATTSEVGECEDSNKSSQLSKSGSKFPEADSEASRSLLRSQPHTSIQHDPVEESKSFPVQGHDNSRTQGTECGEQLGAELAKTSSSQKSTGVQSGLAQSSRRPALWGRSPAKKNLSMESIHVPPDDVTEIQRLEVSKTDLQLKIAEQAKGNALLQKSLENRKNALHERRLALEKDVAQLQEQLQKERVLRKLLEAGVNMSMVTSPVSSSINGMEEIMETVQAEGGNLGVQHNKHGEESSTLRPDVGDQPQQSLNLQGKDCDKQKDVESIATSQNLEKSTRDKLETCSNKADGDKDMNESQLSGNKHLSQSKQSDSSSSPNSSVGLVNSSSVEEVGMGRGPSTSIRNLGSTNETHVPKEIQNLDKGNYGQPVHNIEREKESESHHSLDKLQASQSQTSDMGGSNSQQALHKPDQGTKS
ncbi:rho GTPase-activating protein REN1-like isoform X2 [Lycium barbarum]|uniref:rho GTPase-activating protein REN1-like isoform X2 n=1 Tax=Lycium barbarum TaxID=112863 RepID=UPI00293EE2B5|nr:rho GTPase-activating protein REN1-like isoform X2 [Lycium barbarum]